MNARVIIYLIVVYQSSLIKSLEDDNNTHRILFPDVDTHVGRSNPEKQPYQICIMRAHQTQKNLYQTVCRGAIVSPTKVVTVAHCFIKRVVFLQCDRGNLKGRLLKHTAAVAAQYKLEAEYNRSGQWKFIKNGRYPYEYDFPDHDIAILYLYSHFDWTTGVQPVALTTELHWSARYNVDWYCHITGFWREYRLDKEPELILMQITVSTTCEICKDFCTQDKKIAKIERLVLDGAPLGCKVEKDKNVKRGDFGLLGLVIKSGNLSQSSEEDTVFTRVASYYDFIKTGSARKLTQSILLCSFILCLQMYLIFYLSFIN